MRLGRYVLLGMLLASPLAHAQGRDSSLTDGEVEKLRDSAYVPAERLMIFIGFLNERSDGIRKLGEGPRKPGREEDLHDLYQQFTDIADELNDNLDDYGPKHKDLRKSLPKLLSAAERWATALRTPAENEEYGVLRRMALEAVKDLKDEATEMLAEQKTYFLAHPVTKDEADKGGGESPHPRP